MVGARAGAELTTPGGIDAGALRTRDPTGGGGTVAAGIAATPDVEACAEGVEVSVAGP